MSDYRRELLRHRVDFSRNVPADAEPELIGAVEAEIRAHLSAVTSPTDDPEEHVGEVQLEHEQDGDELKIHGWINRGANAAYLEHDWTPEEEAVANPLSCPSIDDDPSVLHAELTEED